MSYNFKPGDVGVLCNLTTVRHLNGTVVEVTTVNPDAPAWNIVVVDEWDYVVQLPFPDKRATARGNYTAILKHQIKPLEDPDQDNEVEEENELTITE
jgi:hypothetical protein